MKLVKPIKKNDINKFINYFEQSKSKWSTRNLTIFELGLTVGLRVSDLISLKFYDVFDHKNHVRNRIVPIREQKTGKKNYYMFLNNPRTRKQLMNYYHWMNDNNIYHKKWLFPNSKNERKPLEPVSWYRTLKRASKDIGIKYDVGTHSLRKTFGMLQYNASKFDIAYVQKRLNHSSPEITERYLGLDCKSITDKAKAIGGTF